MYLLMPLSSEDMLYFESKFPEHNKVLVKSGFFEHTDEEMLAMAKAMKILATRMHFEACALELESEAMSRLLEFARSIAPK